MDVDHLDTGELFERAACGQSRGEGAPLRLAQAQGTRPDRARRLALRLPALTQGRPSRPTLPLLPQAPVRPPRQQPLPSPAGPATPSRQPARSRLSPRRHRNPTRRRSLGCGLIAPRLNDNVQLVRLVLSTILLLARAPGRAGAPLFLLTNCRRVRPDSTPKIAHAYLA